MIQYLIGKLFPCTKGSPFACFRSHSNRIPLKSIAAVGQNFHVIDTYVVCRIRLTRKDHAEVVGSTDRLKEPETGTPGVGRVSGDGATCDHTSVPSLIFIRVSNREPTAVVGWVLEAVVHLDGVILTRADVHRLGQGEATRVRVEWIIAICGEIDCESILATIAYAAPWAADAVVCRPTDAADRPICWIGLAILKTTVGDVGPRRARGGGARAEKSQPR